MRFFVSVLFILGISFFAASAQKSLPQRAQAEYAFKQYTVHDGLVQMQVQNLFQDKKGYLWCGTKTGISRFDGRTFKNHSCLEIKQSSPVVFLNQNSDGNLLVFNQKNLSVLYPDSVASINYPANFGLNEFSTKPCRHYFYPLCIIINSTNQKQNFLLNFENVDSMFVEEFNPFYGNRLFFNEQTKNLIWQIRNDSIFEVHIFNKEIVASYRNPGINVFKYFAGDWYGFSHLRGVFKLVNNNFEPVLKDELGSGFLKVIHSPDNKSLIISSKDKLFQFGNNKLKTIKSGMTLIRDIMFDHEGNLWVASEEGLYNFFKLNFVNYTFGKGNKDWVWSIVQDADSNMWFSSYQNGIWKWDGKKITDYTNFLNQQKKNNLGIHYDYTYFMGASSFGNRVYFPTNYNVLVLDGKTFSAVNEPDNAWNKAYFFSKTQPDSMFYCGGMNGLFEISPSQKKRKWTAELLGISTIMNVEIDKDKNIFVIGSTGIAKIANDSVFHIQKNEVYKNYCSASDHKGNIWIGGNQALKKLSNNSLEKVSPKGNEHYFSVLFVEPYYLLMGGINGLYITDLNEYYLSGIFEPVLYNRHNGFLGTECGQNGFFTDLDGYVWINTSDMVTRFNPQKLVENKPVAPYLYLNTQLSEDNIHWKKVDANNQNGFNFKQNSFRFVLNPVSFCNVQNLRFYYKLVGFQSDWSESSAINEIIFYNLKPGEYELQARADAGTCNASSEIVSFQFHIKNPFWFKWWFVLLMALSFISITTGTVILLNRRVKRKELVKKRIVQLRADALQSQMNPHLIFNALNNINGLINLGEKKRAQNYLNTFARLLRLVLKTTNKHEITLENELEIVRNFIQFHHQASSNTFDYEIKLELNIDSDKILVPPVIIQPFVENAILHGLSGGSIQNGFIKVNVKNENKRLIISVEDNGVGYGNSKGKGNGLGTKLTNERIQLLEKKGVNQMQIIKLTKGTKVEINIPLKLIQ